MLELLQLSNDLSISEVPINDKSKINYAFGGKSGRNIIFIHGWQCIKEHWSQQLKYFSKSFRVFAVDLPGNNNYKTAGEIYSIDDLVDDLIAFIQAINIDNAYLIGHSSGGIIALESSKRLGLDRFPAIAVDSLIYPGTYEAYPEEKIKPVLHAFRSDFEKMVYENMANLFGPNADSELKETVAAQCTLGNKAIALSIFESLLKWDIHQSLSDIDIQIPCICSELLHKENHSEELDEKFNLITIPDSGHFCMLEQPELVNNAIEHFL